MGREEVKIDAKRAASFDDLYSLGGDLDRRRQNRLEIHMETRRDTCGRHALPSRSLLVSANETPPTEDDSSRYGECIVTQCVIDLRRHGFDVQTYRFRHSGSSNICKMSAAKKLKQL